MPQAIVMKFDRDKIMPIAQGQLRATMLFAPGWWLCIPQDIMHEWQGMVHYGSHKQHSWQLHDTHTLQHKGTNAPKTRLDFCICQGKCRR